MMCVIYLVLWIQRYRFALNLSLVKWQSVTEMLFSKVANLITQWSLIRSRHMLQDCNIVLILHDFTICIKPKLNCTITIVGRFLCTNFVRKYHTLKIFSLSLLTNSVHIVYLILILFTAFYSPNHLHIKILYSWIGPYTVL